MKSSGSRAHAVKCLTNGTRNEVVQSHPHACQHCGFYGIPADVTCTKCGVRAHSQCLEFREGLCGLCSAGEDEHATQCALCQRDDPRTDRQDATDRLTKQVAYYGRHWTRSSDDEALLRAAGYEVLDPESVCIDRGPVRRRHLKQGGACKMAIRHDGAMWTSDPVVVHTWCALCLFQISPREGDEAWADHIAMRLETPLRLEVGHSGRDLHDDRDVFHHRATCNTHACLFCDDDKGWTTYCVYHQFIPSGCPTCRTDTKGVGKRRTSLFFHPSCAVRHGMQRFGRGGRFGMLCQTLQRQWRSKRLARCKTWLGFPSGINEHLKGFEDVTEDALMPPHDVACKGVTTKSTERTSASGQPWET